MVLSLLLVLTAVPSVDDSPPPLVPADTEARPKDEPFEAPTRHVGITMSPVSTFMLAVAVDVEVRITDRVTVYGTGEYYGLWQGVGAQLGLRTYFSEAFHGFFVDAHARVADLYLAHVAGGGAEIGSQHSLGHSAWTILWSAGLDVGAGAWSPQGREIQNVALWFEQDLVAVPKLRFMLGYTF